MAVPGKDTKFPAHVSENPAGEVGKYQEPIQMRKEKCLTPLSPDILKSKFMYIIPHLIMGSNAADARE